MTAAPLTTPRSRTSSFTPNRPRSYRPRNTATGLPRAAAATPLRKPRRSPRRSRSGRRAGASGDAALAFANRARKLGLRRLQRMIPHSSRAQMPGPTSVRTTVHGPGLARVHHGSTSVSKGGSARRLQASAKRSPCRGFATSCARPSPPFIRRGTTHNREVGGSNPPGAIAVVQRNAVPRGRPNMCDGNPLCRAVVVRPLSQV